MRKSFCWIAMAALLLVSGCGSREEMPQPTSGSVAAPTAAPVDDGIPVATPEPTAEAPAEAPAGSILDTKQPMDEKAVLFRIPHPVVESAVQQEVVFYQEQLLLHGPVATEQGPGYRLARLSMTDGTVTGEITLTGLELPELQIRGDVPAVSDYSHGTLQLLNGGLDLSGEYVSAYAPCGVYLSSDGEKYYSVAQTGIFVTDRNTGSTETLLDNVTNLYAGGSTGNGVSIRYTDLTTQLDRQAVLDLADGRVDVLPFEGVYTTAECADGLWLAGREDGWYIGRGNRPSTFVIGESYSHVTLLTEPVRLLVSSWNEQGAETLRLYSAQGRFLSECTLPAGGGRFGEPAWSERHGGYFFTIVDPDGSDRLVFWDLSVPVSGADLSLSAAYAPLAAGTVVSQSLYERAADLGSRYGVTVKIAEQTDGSYRHYTAVKELDEAYIAVGLDALESALSAYPAGFLPQLHHGSCQSIEFQLTGAIEKTRLPETVSGFSGFSAFVEGQQGKTLVVLDVNQPGSLEQTICHEIAHLVDDKLTFDAALRPEALYSEANWAALNPSGFVYAETYDEMPMHYFNDGYENYFLDIYSRTFAREDRARILEYAMTGADYVFSTPERLAKLDYLSRCIRDGFDTSGWPDQTPWEATLQRCQ